MTMPEDSKDATRFVVVVSKLKNDLVERSTFVFDRSVTLANLFNDIFSEGRIKGHSGNQLPFQIEISPDLSSLPKPKTILERVMDRQKEREDLTL